MTGVLSSPSPIPGSDTIIITPPRGTFLTTKLEETTPFSDQPFMVATDLTYTKPTMVMYENLNADRRLHKRMTNYYRYKCIDNWVANDLAHVVTYFKTTKNEDKIKQLLEHKVLTKNVVYSILTKFVYNTSTNWYDLHKNEKYLQEAFSIAIRKLVKKLNL